MFFALKSERIFSRGRAGIVDNGGHALDQGRLNQGHLSQGHGANDTRSGLGHTTIPSV